jgi:iron complex outermembrane receptor protein
VLANYTHVKSKITYITRVDNPNTTANELLTQTANFTGLSPDAYNLTLYYEDEKFSARVSAAHRSDYLLNVLGDVNGHDVHRRRRLDQHRLQRLLQHQQAAAPVDRGPEPDRRAAALRPRLRRNDTLLYVHSGRSFVVGLNYRF